MDDVSDVQGQNATGSATSSPLNHAPFPKPPLIAQPITQLHSRENLSAGRLAKAYLTMRYLLYSSATTTARSGRQNNNVAAPNADGDGDGDGDNMSIGMRAMLLLSVCLAQSLSPVVNAKSQISLHPPCSFLRHAVSILPNWG